MWISGATGVVAVATAGAGFVHAPHTTVALPGAQASPATVIRTYVRAINDRDYSTANAIQLRGPRIEDHGWFDAPSIRHLNVTHVTPVYSGKDVPSSSVTSFKQVVEVDIRGQFHHWDDGLPGGDHMVSYYLGRNTDAQRWRIVDEGQG